VVVEEPTGPLEVEGAQGLGVLPMAEASSAEGPGALKEKQIYSLNPFDGGATRDLGKPTGAGSPDATPPEVCDTDEEEGEA